jgi:hypothetical protein
MPSGTLMADSQSSLSSNPFNTYFWTPHFPLLWISLVFWPPWKKPVKPLMVIHEWVDFQTAKLRDRERESPLQQSNGLQQSHKLGLQEWKYTSTRTPSPLTQTMPSISERSNDLANSFPCCWNCVSVARKIAHTHWNLLIQMVQKSIIYQKRNAELLTCQFKI